MGLRDYENGITGLRILYFLGLMDNLNLRPHPSQNMNKGLRDHIYHNPEILTCISWHYGITELHTF